MLVTQFPPGVLKHGDLTAVSKGLVSERLGISYDLSLAPLSHELGVLFSDPTDSAGKLSTSCGDALVCSYYVRCVSTRIYWRRFGIIVETGAVKVFDKRRTSQS